MTEADRPTPHEADIQGAASWVPRHLIQDAIHQHRPISYVGIYNQIMPDDAALSEHFHNTAPTSLEQPLGHEHALLLGYHATTGCAAASHIFGQLIYPVRFGARAEIIDPIGLGLPIRRRQDFGLPKAPIDMLTYRFMRGSGWYVHQHNPEGNHIDPAEAVVITKDLLRLLDNDDALKTVDGMYMERDGQLIRRENIMKLTAAIKRQVGLSA